MTGTLTKAAPQLVKPHEVKRSRPALVLYHDNCADGTAAAIVAVAALGEDTEARAVNYGDAIPSSDDLRDRVVWIVDFSYPRESLRAIAARSQVVLIFDHHKTAQADLEALVLEDKVPNLNAWFDLQRSGAAIVFRFALAAGLLSKAFEHAFGWLVLYVEDRDLWNWEMPNSRAVSAALQSLGRKPSSFESWREFARRGVINATAGGQFVLDYQSQEIRDAVARARLLHITLGGKATQVPVVNVSGRIVSEVVGDLAEDFGYAVGWWQNRAGEIIVSLRSNEYGEDVGALAKLEGGGGHSKAAGITFPNLAAWLACIRGDEQ